MSRPGGTMRTTRPKKLTSKQPIPIFREHQISSIDDEGQLALQSIETGVEKAEESEYHLQAVIHAARLGTVSEAYIPTPETVVSSIQYDKLYLPIFSQPATYIRFSSTVEDCSGCSYDMTSEDEIALKKLNARRDAQVKCSEDRFEEIMAFFEDTAQMSQPFAAVDHPPVISYAEMEQSFDNFVDEVNRKLAPHIYEHWKARRTKLGNRPLKPSLKFETGRETDDSDPYVCFRRREVRQVRKTRGRDAQSAEKLRKLRKELEDARELLALVRQRETSRKEQLLVEKQLFQQRCEVKEIKRKLHLKDDDEDLINQKAQRKRPPEVLITNKNANIAQTRPTGKPALVSDELRSLESVQAEKEMAILADIRQNIAKHARWNEGYVDWTTMPLAPALDRPISTAFRPAITTEYLPTPPSSESSHSHLNHCPVRNLMADVRSNVDLLRQEALLRQSTPPSEDLTRRMPCFRRRVGRGGRMLIDRRNMQFMDRTVLDPVVLERYKYDHDEDLEEPVYEHDPHDVRIMQHRTYLTTRSRDQAAAAASQAQLQSHMNSSSQAQANYMQAQLAQLQQGPGAGSQLQAKLAQRQILNERLGRAIAVKPSP
ncbi:Enhancer of polycomb-like protein 1 [Ascosphaera aggregata]|nr:Enhancer of polycomb-like protein 1 [Ascosphaera aggregata]